MVRVPEPAMRTVTILVVEDSPTQRETLRFLLEESGYAVVLAANGCEGLSAAKASRVDLVISDVVMPEMDGYELCRALRADGECHRLPVIMLTSLSDPKDVIRGLEAGADNFICKPYEDQALLARVESVLANLELRKSVKSEIGVNIFFAGQQFLITSDRLQILDLLLSTYENAVIQNKELIHARNELRVLNLQLETQVAEATADLKARIKEIRCLYSISNLVAAPRKSIQASLEAALPMIPQGWQYPEAARSRIRFEGLTFSLDGFQDTAWKQSADLVVSGQTIGTVEVSYLEEKPPRDEGPFLQEERNLVNDIARQLGVMIEKMRSEAQVEYLARFPKENRSPVLRVALDGTLVYANPSSVPLLQHWGSQPGQKLPEAMTANVHSALTTGLRQEVELECAGQSYALDLCPVMSEGYVSIYGYDITRRKRAEEALQRLTDIHATLSQTNQAVVRAQTEEELLRETVRICVEFGHFDLAWIGEADEERGCVRILAASGPASGFIEGLEISLDPQRVEGLGPSGKCLREGHLVIVQDWDQDLSLAPWRERGRSFGIQASASFALFQGNRARAVLSLYSREAYAFTQERLKLLEEMSMDLGYALDGFTSERLRRQAEKSLKVSEENYRGIFDNFTLGVYRTTEDGRFLLANPAFVKMLGYTSFEQIQALNLEKDAQNHGFNRSAFKKAFKKGDEIVGLESPWVRTDGKIVFIRENARVIRDNDGQVLYYEGYVEDVTEARAAAAREQLFRATLQLLNSVDDGDESIGSILQLIKKHLDIEAVGLRLREGNDFPYFLTEGFSEDFVITERFLCEKNSAGDVVYDSKGNCVLECMCGRVILGQTNPSMPFFTEGGSFWTNGKTALLDSVAITELQANTRNRFKNENYESIALVPLKSGQEIIGLLQLNDHRPNRFTLDTIHFFEGLGASIGIALARKQSAEARQSSELRYRRLFESAKDGILILEAETGRIMDANPSLAVLLGHTQEAVIGKQLWELGVFGDYASAINSMEEVKRKGSLRYEDKPMETSDGGKVHVEVISNVYRVNDRQVIQCNIRDITEQRLAAAEIRSLNENLEKKIQERTLLLQSANTELESYSYSISHDLKAPLRSIAGFSQAVIEDYADLLPAEGREYLQRAQDEAIRMGGLIEDLLRLSRFGKQEMATEELDLTALAHSILHGLAGLEPTRRVKFALEPNLKVHGDSVLIRVLMDNLLGNAWKFTSKTEAATIQVRRCPSEAGWLAFSISDNGAGFDPAYVDRLFTPFRRLHSTEEFAGTGIGLAIVRRIAQRHGGTVEAEGRPGNGATFTVVLPEPQP